MTGQRRGRTERTDGWVFVTATVSLLVILGCMWVVAKVTLRCCCQSRTGACLHVRVCVYLMFVLRCDYVFDCVCLSVLPVYMLVQVFRSICLGIGVLMCYLVCWHLCTQSCRSDQKKSGSTVIVVL